MRGILCGVLLGGGALLQPVTAAADCNLLQRYDGVGVFRSSDGLVSFAANVDVNTDGSLHSYHPYDPGNFNAGRLDTRYAMNTVCNGVNIRNADGSLRYDYRSCGRLLTAFAQLRDSGWRSADGAYVQWYAIAARDRTTPCIGPGGYFVSQTARPLLPTADVCAPERWPDAQLLSSIVLPNDPTMRAAGVRLGDIALVRANGRVTGAVFIDSNPRKVGEASVRVAQTLRGQTAPPTSYRQTLAMSLPEAEYFVFPGSRSELGPLTNGDEARIQEAAARLAARHGIANRTACSRASG